MASVTTEGGENGLNVELNLVPFIDLLSSLVLFLLVTAVWLQVGTIPTNIESPGKAQASASPENRIMIHLGKGHFQLTWPIAFGRRLPSSLDQNLEHLQRVLQEAASKQKSLSSVGVSSEDGVEYGLVVSTVDTAKKAGFVNVALSTQ